MSDDAGSIDSARDLRGTGGRMRLPRTRGAVSGIVLIVLGLWGGLVPFIGPSFDFAFTPHANETWHWTAARGWYEVLPGGVALLGGLLLLFSANRALTSFGAWLGIVAGGWFVVAPQLSPLLVLGHLGTPANGGQREMALEYLVYFTGLGAVIVLFGALAAGRLSVHSIRDARTAARRDAEAQRAEQDRVRAEQEQQREDALRSRSAATNAAPAVEPDPEPAPAASSAAQPEPAAEHASTPEQATDSEPSTGPIEQPDAEDTASHPSTGSPTTSTSDAPGYATPQRYTRSPSEQIPVEQIQRDHPTQ